MSSHAHALSQPAVTLHPLDEADIPAVIALAERVWNDHYPNIISQAQIDYMIAGRYTPEKMRALAATPNGHFLVAHSPAISGFLYMTQEADGSFFIHQCYVDTQAHGQGIGRALLQGARAIAGTAPVTLHVARENVQAINFYVHNGMSIDGLVDLDIGGGFAIHDYLMNTHPASKPRPSNTGEMASLRPATHADIPGIVEAAGRIWRAHYPGIISDAQIDYMLADRYSPARLQELLTPAENRVLVVTTEDSIRGFLVLCLKDGQPFIDRCYIDADLQGNGIGSALMAEAITYAQGLPLRLQVNRLNTSAIRFYFKQGFHIERTQITDVGQGYVMDDFVMLRFSDQQHEGRPAGRPSREPARTPRRSVSQEASAETNQKDTPR